MKRLTFFIILLNITSAIAQEINSDYDSLLAKKLGADDKGIKTYVIGILKTGSNDVQDKKARDILFKGHIDFIERLIKNGDIVTAGPLEKNENSYRGLFILNVSTIEEANRLLQLDPSIKEKLFAADLYKWSTSAALPMYFQFQNKIEKYKRKRENY
jgi:hypothetical protein